jgi:aminopeptidase
MNEAQVATAAKHINDILTKAMQITPETRVLVVADQDCALAEVLKSAYLQCVPTADHFIFNDHAPEFFIEKFQEYPASSLVVLIQTTNFRLNAFRVRVELFNQQLKVIEHPHLGRMVGEEVNYYLDALAYDSSYYRTVGPALKTKLDQASGGVVDSGDASLHFDARFESAKLNIGDYTDMKNVGGQFPIGEVFTEACELEAVHGRVNIFAFGDTKFSVNKTDKPITLIIEAGRVVGTENTTPEFECVLANIRADEGEVWLRELGFGLNRAFTPERVVTDIGTYERMCGVHLSLGAKHSMYRKPQFTRSTARHHVDVFVATKQVRLDNEVVYEHGQWVV